MTNGAWLREDEIRFRARGLFQAAVQAQRLADLLEHGDELPLDCCYLDRGSLEPISGYVNNGVLFIRLPNIDMAFVLTRDRAEQLAAPLLTWLGFVVEES